MNRVNTITKLKYNEDPTIMSWDLINEGRCEANCTAAEMQVHALPALLSVAAGIPLASKLQCKWQCCSNF